MVDFRFPELEQFLAANSPAREQLPLPQFPAPAPPPQRNLLAAGLSAGIDQLQGLGGSAASALGQAVGIDGLQRWGAEIAARNEEEARINGRPDLEIAPWREGGASFLPWLAYQATKQIPQVGATIAGAALMPQVAVPAALARAGAAVPAILGGGRGLAGEAAQQAGRAYGASLLGAAAVGAPLGAGSLYGEALDRQREGGEAPTRGEAFGALALAPVYGGLEAVQPASITRALKQGLKGNLPTRVGKAVGIGMVTEAPTEALQTVLENTFRPDLTAAQKAERIVDAALTGAAVGGVLGSVGGIRSAKVSGLDASTEELKAKTDEALALPAPEQPRLLEGPNWRGAAEAPVSDRLGDVDADTLAAARGRMEQRLFEGEASPGLSRELAAYRGEEARRSFADMDDQSLAENLSRLRARLDQGEQNVGLQTRADALAFELDRRQALANRVEPQGLLFGEQELAQPDAGTTRPIVPAAPPAPEFTSLQSYAADILTDGGSRKLGKREERYIRSLDARSDVELARRVSDDAQRTSSVNSPALQLAERLGLTEPQPQLEARLRVAQQAVLDAGIDERSGAAPTGSQAAMQRFADRIEAQLALREAVRAPDGTPGGDQRAPSAATPPPGQQTGLTQTQYAPEQLAARFEPAVAAPAPVEVQGELPLTMGRQTATPAPNPQTFEQAAQFLKTAAATTSNTQVENIGRVTVPDAVARISTLIGDKPPKSAVLTRMGRYFGLLDANNRPVSIETAIANTENEIAALEQRSAALPQVPATVRAQYNEQSTRLTERLDALRAARDVQSIDQTIYDPATPDEVRSQARAARTQLTGEFPEPSIQAELRATPFPEAPAAAPAPAASSVASEPTTAAPTARPAPVRRTQASVQAERQAAATPTVRDTPASDPALDPPPAPTPDPNRLPPNPEAVRGVNSSETGKMPADQQMREVVSQVEGVRESLKSRLAQLGPGERFTQMRRALYGMFSFKHLTDTDGIKLFGKDAAQRLYRAMTEIETTVRERLSQPVDAALSEFRQLEKSKPKSYAAISELAPLATAFNLRPGLPWSQQKWLHKEPNADVLKRKVAEANNLYNLLRRQGTTDVFWRMTDIGRMDRFAGIAENLYSMVKGNPLTKDLPGFDVDPIIAFVESSAVNQTTDKAADFFKAIVERQLAAIEAYLGSTADPKKGPAITKELQRAVADSRRRFNETEQGVYFHLGRFGKYKFNIQLAPAGDSKDAPPSDASLKAVAAALDKAGFADVQVMEGTSRRNVFIRVDTMDELEGLAKMGSALIAQGFAVKGSMSYGARETQQGSGISEQQFQDLQNRFALALDTTVDSAKYQEIIKAQNNRALDTLRAVYIDSQPDNALIRVLQQREGVSGFSKNLVRNTAFRHNVGSSALAQRVASRYTNEAMRELQQQLKTAQSEGSVRDVIAMSDYINEAFLRQNQYFDPTVLSLPERVRGFSYHYYLSMSPAYLLSNLTQVATLGWPELAKMTSRVKASQALFKAAPEAFKVMKAVASVGLEVGDGRVAEATITDKALERAVKDGLPSELRSYLLQVANTGGLDIGSMVYSLGRLADGQASDKTERMLRYVGAASYYTETFNRVIMAIAVRNIKGDTADVVAKAKDVIDQSMLNYTTANTARSFGRQGFAGEATPIALQFSQFGLLTLEKIMRELGTTFNSSLPKAERKEALKFLGNMMISTGVLAGTLGLPFASVIFRAIEGAVELFGDEDDPFDAKSAYRTFLSDTFGEQASNVITRGVADPLGFGLSSRISLADLIPFSQFLTDRRNIEDLMDARASDLLGPAFDMAINTMAGLREVYKGEYMKGMQSLLPNALKGPLKAYELSDKGYVDKQGRAIPMEADALDIFYQAMGFTPAEKARYNEDRMAGIVRTGQLTRRASELRMNLAKAIESGDDAARDKFLAQAVEFDQTNPAYSVLKGLPAYMQAREKASAVSGATRTPLGTNIRDPKALELSRGYNW